MGCPWVGGMGHLLRHTPTQPSCAPSWTLKDRRGKVDMALASGGDQTAYEL